MAPKIDRNLATLHPELEWALSGLLEYLTHAYETGKTQTLFKLYEGYRSPERQLYLFTKTKSTKARPWQSGHQYGLAADLVPFDSVKGWSWDDKHDWEFMRAAARDFTLLTPIQWDLAHVEHPLFLQVKKIGMTDLDRPT